MPAPGVAFVLPPEHAADKLRPAVSIRNSEACVRFAPSAAVAPEQLASTAVIEEPEPAEIFHFSDESAGSDGLEQQPGLWAKLPDEVILDVLLLMARYLAHLVHYANRVLIKGVQIQ